MDRGKKYSSEGIKTRWKLNWNQLSFKMLIHFHVDLSQMFEMNYKEKNLKVEKHWKRRILIPIEKITAIKTLLISQLNHLFTMLPNPPD